MFTSSGVQWFLLAFMKYSQAQGYLNGASWLMSVSPFSTRLSSTRTGRGPWVEGVGVAGVSFQFSITIAPVTGRQAARHSMAGLLAGFTIRVVDSADLGRKLR